MFLGEYQHSLDPKGRLILPARFRELLTQAFVSCQQDGCLALWAPAEFEERAQEMKDRSKGSTADRHMARVFFAGAQEASPDRQGRIAVPQNLRDFAGLDQQVVVIGAFDHVEIWDTEAWRRAKGLGESALQSDGSDSGGSDSGGSPQGSDSSDSGAEAQGSDTGPQAAQATQAAQTAPA